MGSLASRRTQQCDSLLKFFALASLLGSTSTPLETPAASSESEAHSSTLQHSFGRRLDDGRRHGGGKLVGGPVHNDANKGRVRQQSRSLKRRLGDFNRSVAAMKTVQVAAAEAFNLEASGNSLVENRKHCKPRFRSEVTTMSTSYSLSSTMPRFTRWLQDSIFCNSRLAICSEMMSVCYIDARRPLVVQMWQKMLGTRG